MDFRLAIVLLIARVVDDTRRTLRLCLLLLAAAPVSGIAIYVGVHVVPALIKP
ncbi:hypothetical protein ACPPVO_22695 [Dactylosporangium sp. McL0621]|uniref:hypothetical protein n=1 Tax=Dactylosporangium sp. McL0621 TaxID=3415678 RepID=UPI003CF53570